MKLLALNCNECGASIEVSEQAKFVTCGFCSTRLRVQHTDTSAFTEALEEMASDLDEIRRDVAITRLDQEWMQERQKHLVQNSDGSTSAPTIGSGIVTLVLATAIGSFFVSQAGAVGFLVIGFGVIAFAGQALKASNYQDALQAYESQRKELTES